VYGGIQLTFQYTIISITSRLLYWCAKHGTITKSRLFSTVMGVWEGGGGGGGGGLWGAWSASLSVERDLLLFKLFTTHCSLSHVLLFKEPCSLSTYTKPWFPYGRKNRVTIFLNGQFITVYTCEPHIYHEYSLVIITPRIFSSKMLYFGWWERSSPVSYTIIAHSRSHSKSELSGGSIWVHLERNLESQVLNSWRVSSHIVRYDTDPPAVQKLQWHSREA
jgi:hypothetical protein